MSRCRGRSISHWPRHLSGQFSRRGRPLNRITIAGSGPENLIGLWRRRLLETETVRDTGSEVWWLQTEELYAALHLPTAAPGRRACRQGNAGALKVRDDLLVWQGWLGNPKDADIVDIRRMHFDGQNLVGQGVRAPLREIWERVAPPSDDRLALALRDECTAAGDRRVRRGVFVVLGDYFMFALDRSLCLASRARMGSTRPCTFAVFRLEHEISFGVRRGQVSWEIQRSTLPYREGQSLIAVHGLPEPVTRCEWHQRVQIPAALRRWQAVEIGARFTGLV